MKWHDKLYLTTIAVIIFGLIGFYIGRPVYYHFKNNTTKAKENLESKVEMFRKKQETINPANDIILIAMDYYKKGDYERALSETRKAMSMSIDHDVQGLGHYNLVDIYEITGKYDLAIESIDWLIKNYVNEEEGTRLQKKKMELQELLFEQKK